MDKSQKKRRRPVPRVHLVQADIGAALYFVRQRSETQMAERKYRNRSFYDNEPVYGQLAVKSNPKREPRRQEKPSVEIYTAPLRIDETFTARELRETRAAKRANAFSIAAAFVVVLFGIIAIVRFSSIFELRKQTQLLEKDTAAMTKTLATEQAYYDAELRAADADKIAEKLGMQKPQRYQIVNVSIPAADTTEMHSLLYETAQPETAWYEKLMESIKTFFGKIDLA